MVLPLMGSKEGDYAYFNGLVNEGDEVAGPRSRIIPPTLPYRNWWAQKSSPGTKNNGWQLMWMNWKKGPLKSKIMWINSPHMPTGSVMAVAHMKRLVALARANRFLLVNDNPYGLIRNISPSIFQLKGGRSGAELNSLEQIPTTCRAGA